MIEFDNWLEREKANGLIDIRISVANKDGINVDAIKREILAAEAAIARGDVQTFPK